MLGDSEASLCKLGKALGVCVKPFRWDACEAEDSRCFEETDLITERVCLYGERAFLPSRRRLRSLEASRAVASDSDPG